MPGFLDVYIYEDISIYVAMSSKKSGMTSRQNSEKHSARRQAGHPPRQPGIHEQQCTVSSALHSFHEAKSRGFEDYQREPKRLEEYAVQRMSRPASNINDALREASVRSRAKGIEGMSKTVPGDTSEGSDRFAEVTASATLPEDEDSSLISND